jgi:hypothetical protein
MRTWLIETVVNRDHPDQLKAIAETEEALELLEAATTMARDAARSVAEFPNERMFDAFFGEDKTPPVKVIEQPGAVSDEQKHSDAFHEQLLASARAEIAAL